MESGALSLAVVSFTLDVALLGCADKFRMSRSRQCSWGTAAIRDNLRLSLNNLTTSDAVNRILNPYRTQWFNSPRMNAVILGVNSEAWGPFAMARSRALHGQAIPICTGMPLSMYSCGRGAVSC